MTQRVLRAAVAALRQWAAEAPFTVTLTDAVLGEGRDSLTATPPGDATILPWAVADFGSGVSRVIRQAEADLPGLRLAWGVPLAADEVPGPTVTVRNAPLAGTAIYLGGGPTVPRSVTIWCDGVRHGTRAIGRQYGSRSQTVELLAGVRTAFVPEDDDFETSGLAHLQLVEQVSEILERGLPDSLPPALIQDTDHQWFRLADGPFVYAAEIRAEMEVRV